MDEWMNTYCIHTYMKVDKWWKSSKWMIDSQWQKERKNVWKRGYMDKLNNVGLHRKKSVNMIWSRWNHCLARAFIWPEQGQNKKDSSWQAYDRLCWIMNLYDSLFIIESLWGLCWIMSPFASYILCLSCGLIRINIMHPWGQNEGSDWGDINYGLGHSVLPEHWYICMQNRTELQNIWFM